MTRTDIESIVARILDEDRVVISYRPSWKDMTGSVNASILLQQVRFRWRQKGGPFYKFFTPPTKDHNAYKPGDSWTEELGFTLSELQGAMKRIAKRLNRKDVENMPASLDGAFFGYYRDQKHLTWHYFNEKYFIEQVIKHYGSPDDNSPSGKFPSGKLSSGEMGNSHLAKREFPISINTESPTETTNKDNLDSSFDSFFPEPTDHGQDGLSVATDSHQREIEKSLGSGVGSDPLEEIAKHLCWGIRGLGAQLPQAKKNRNTWLNAARLLLDETNAAGEWIAVCDAIDEWFKGPPKADEWSRDNAKKPHDPVPAIARYYSRQAASARQTTPGKVNGAAGFALEVFTGPVPEKRQLSEIEQTWQQVCEVLQTGMARATFDQIIKPCRLEKPNGVYQIISPEQNIGWLENRLKSQIIKAIEYVAGAGAKVEILAQ